MTGIIERLAVPGTNRLLAQLFNPLACRDCRRLADLGPPEQA
jgi:hypothetical protein